MHITCTTDYHLPPNTATTTKNHNQPLHPATKGDPLTHPPPGQKSFHQAHLVIAPSKHTQSRTDTIKLSEIEIQLAEGDYSYLVHTLERDTALWNYAQDKTQYYYHDETRIIDVTMPRPVHESLLESVKYELLFQLKAIGKQGGKKEEFANKVKQTGSPDTSFKYVKNVYRPDSTFKHKDAHFPGVILEVAGSQTHKNLDRLAEAYLVHSVGNIRAVIGLKVQYYGKSRKATLSIWRPQLFDGSDGPELRAVCKVANEVFRDDDGNPVDSPGIQLRLSDFACKTLVEMDLKDENADICISGKELCAYVDEAEDESEGLGVTDPPNDRITMRIRSLTPPEQLNSDDEARFVLDEAEAEARQDDEDPGYRPLREPTPGELRVMKRARKQTSASRFQDN